MDTSFLYNGLGLKGLECTATHYKGSEIVLDVQYAKPMRRCPHCGEYGCVKNGSRRRRIQTVPIGSTQLFLNMKVQRYRCNKCGHNGYEKARFVSGNRCYTRRLAKYVVMLLRCMTIQDVAKLLHLSWDVVKEIHLKHLERRYRRPSLRGVESIGIDEFAVRRGHVYKTIVVDLISGRILHAGDGKGADALDEFWKRVRKEGINIRYVATDMSSAFAKSVRENAPDAIYVFDHFHVIKLMNDTLDKIRRELISREVDPAKRRLIKGSRFLLLANSENIVNHSGMSKLQLALEVNKPLSQAYYLKEDFRQIYTRETIHKAEEKFDEWVLMARETAIKPLVKLANTISAAKREILAWYHGKLSTAKVEGINNKIKVMKRNAYGYRDDYYFTLRLFSLHDCSITRNVG